MNWKWGTIFGILVFVTLVSMVYAFVQQTLAKNAERSAVLARDQAEIQRMAAEVAKVEADKQRMAAEEARLLYEKTRIELEELKKKRK
jgi:Tfp pilus assembly protein PilN